MPLKSASITPASIETKCSLKIPDRGNNLPWKPLGIAHLNSNEIMSTEFGRHAFVSAAKTWYPTKSLDKATLLIHSQYNI